MGSLRTHVILPEKLVAEIDALVGQRGRSAFLAEVAEREVKRRRLLELLSPKSLSGIPLTIPRSMLRAARRRG